MNFPNVQCCLPRYQSNVLKSSKNALLTKVIGTLSRHGSYIELFPQNANVGTAVKEWNACTQFEAKLHDNHRLRWIIILDILNCICMRKYWEIENILGYSWIAYRLLKIKLTTNKISQSLYKLEFYSKLYRILKNSFIFFILSHNSLQ